MESNTTIFLGIKKPLFINYLIIYSFSYLNLILKMLIKVPSELVTSISFKWHIDSSEKIHSDKELFV